MAFLLPRMYWIRSMSLKLVWISARSLEFLVERKRLQHFVLVAAKGEKTNQEFHFSFSVIHIRNNAMKNSVLLNSKM